MKSLRGSLVFKLALWGVLLWSIFAALMGGYHTAMYFGFSDTDWKNNRSYQNGLINYANMAVELLLYSLVLKDMDGDANLDYYQVQTLQDTIQRLERQLSEENTNFRYQVRSAENGAVVFSQAGVGEADAWSGDGEYVATLGFDFQAEQFRLIILQNGNEIFSHSGLLSDYLGAVWDTFYEHYFFDKQALQGTLSTATALEPDIRPACLIDLYVDLDHGVARDEFYNQHALMQRLQGDAVNQGIWVLFFIALGFGCFILILWASGHRMNSESIVLTWQEKIYFEVYTGLSILLIGGGIYMILRCISWQIDSIVYEFESYLLSGDVEKSLQYLVSAAALMSTALAALAVLWMRTLTVRIKGHVLRETSLLWRLGRWCARTVGAIFQAMPIIWKSVTGFLLYLFLNFLARNLFWELYPVPVFLVDLLAAAGLCWWALCFHRIQEGGRAIASGNINHRIDTARMPHDLHKHAQALNNISVGLSTAVDEQMKSERFKAELITNVSHDLKTPLTSIINYVDLLKTTEQKDPRAQEYIEVLDRKALRLKKLTEDLVEASKAATGAMAVNREKISMGQLLEQALGEHKERLEGRFLSVCLEMPEGETYVYSDGRHVWRVLDNLLSNCVKYALEGTRVYIELTRGRGQVLLTVKNVSRQALNVPAERLMERFVRGDASRTTEGTGLGLSIAKSLTELQGGTFELVVDGDLFKAIVTLPQAG